MSTHNKLLIQASVIYMDESILNAYDENLQDS